MLYADPNAGNNDCFAWPILIKGRLLLQKDVPCKRSKHNGLHIVAWQAGVVKSWVPGRLDCRIGLGVLLYMCNGAQADDYAADDGNGAEQGQRANDGQRLHAHMTDSQSHYVIG